MFVLTSSDLASVKQKARAWRSCAYIVQILYWCTVSIYIYICISVYIYIFRIFHNWWCEVFGWYELKKKRDESSSLEQVLRLWCLDLPTPFWPTAFGAMVLCWHWEVYLTPWWSIGFWFFQIIQLNCKICLLYTKYTTQYISYILMTVFWYAEATTVTVWQTMRPIDSCLREGPLNSKQWGPGCNTAVSRACFETMQHEHTHNHDYSHMYCNMKRAHTYIMILLIRQFRDLAHHCRAARTRVLNIFNTWPRWLENLFDKVLEPAFCTASSTPWSADTLMTALKGPRVVGSAWGFNAGWGNQVFFPNIWQIKYLGTSNHWCWKEIKHVKHCGKSP